ncbi:MFS transporter [Streptomyces yaizuensis]|uniref:MFS transporter n=1 Tax=Streptomyces yaizuensis TaxID=2989713 RepID=A0ABQ5P6L6_9ACTN|nr:MFS transporter [Streptomyces sp. YSPA8]GLF98217.1 MFS transporter [Streptomyces sp. YSPA8]
MPTTPPPVAVAPERTSLPVRTVITALIGGTLLLKAAGFCWDFLGYYISDGLGHGTTAAGAGLTLFGIGWCAGQAFSGAVTDRLGQRTALIVFMCFSALACFALALTTSLPALMALSLLLGFTMEIHRPAVSAEINDSITGEAARTRAQGWTYWAMNVGIAVCGGLGGYLAHQHGYQLLFVANGIACLVFALIARRVLTPRPRAPRASASLSYRHVLADTSLRWITVAEVGAMICAYGLVSVLPLVMVDDGLPPSAYGAVMIANTAGVLILTPPLMRVLIGRDEEMRFPIAPLLAVGSLILGAGMAFAVLQHTTLGYAIAAVLIVPGEICYSVATGAYISKAAPPGATGRYQAVLSGASATASLPPLGIALALNTGGRPLVAAILAASALTAATACYPLARALRARQAPEPDPRTAGREPVPAAHDPKEPS